MPKGKAGKKGAKPESPRGSEKSNSPRSPRATGDDADLEDWPGLVEALGASTTAKVTTAHRVFAKARDAAFAEYLAYYESSMASVLDHYGRILDEEETWQATWESLVKGLVLVSD